MTGKKVLTMAAALLASATMASPASATIYSYVLNSAPYAGELVVDTETQTATIDWIYLKATMTSPDFANFEGGAKPTFTAMLSSLDGLRFNSVEWLRPNPYLSTTTHPQKLIFDASQGNVNLWAWWGPKLELGDAWFWVNGYSKPPVTSTSTGGSTTTTSTGGTTTGGTTGGTPVPEPGMLGLLAAGLGGLALARRRRRKPQAAQGNLALA